MKGYKVFHSDWTCRGYQYEVGKTYEILKNPKCCEKGFHFCKKIIDCFHYYSFDPANKIAEIEAIGKIDTDDTDSKCCTNKIIILKELEWREVLDMCNSGKLNSEIYNSGNNNSGNYNCGDYNSGHYNSGHCNSGQHNTGDYNSGDYNSGNHNSGYCNTNTPKVRMFNHVTDFDFDDETITRFDNILFNCPQSYKYSDFISISDMSEDEIIRHPECETIGGYIKTIIVEADKQKWWDEDVSDDDKEFIKSLPYFDAEIFYECVGIRIK